jgi:hypothetical protein
MLAPKRKKTVSNDLTIVAPAHLSAAVVPSEGRPRFIPPSALKYLGRPPLVRGEKLHDFNQFRLELAQDLFPRNLSEWLIVDEFAKLKWVTLRLRKAEAGLFNRSLSQLKGISDPQISLGVALEKNIGVIERSNRLTSENERRCDVLLRSLRLLQSERTFDRRSPETIDLEAKEVET